MCENNHTLDDLWVTDTMLFQASWLLNCSIAFIGSIANVLLLALLLSSTSLHRNLRLMIGNYAAAASVQCVGSVAKCAYSFVLSVTNHCDLIIRKVDCRLLELPVTISLQVGIMSVVSIALERAFAVRNHATYHTTSKTGTLALLVAFWTIVIVVVGSGFSGMRPMEYLHYCEAFFVTSPSYKLGLSAAYLSSLILSIVILKVVLVYTETNLGAYRNNRSSLTLHSRLELKKCSEVTHSLLPAMLCNAIVVSVQGILIALEASVLSSSISISGRIVLYQYCIRPLLIVRCVFFPLIFIRRMRVVRNKLVHWLNTNRRQVVPEIKINPAPTEDIATGDRPVDESDIRMQDLFDTWQEAYERRLREQRSIQTSQRRKKTISLQVPRLSDRWVMESAHRVDTPESTLGTASLCSNLSTSSESSGSKSPDLIVVSTF